jgi:hypothetical protein
VTEPAKKPTAADKPTASADQPAIKDPLSTKPCIFEPVVYGRSKPAGQRILAVSAALELIARRLSSSAPADLMQEMKNLKSYADYIQNAAKSK